MEMLFFYSLGIKYNFHWKNKTFSPKNCFEVRAGFDFQLTPMQIKVAVALPGYSHRTARVHASNMNRLNEQ